MLGLVNKRIEFSQKETIQSTKKLMHKTLNRYFGETLSNKIVSLPMYPELSMQEAAEVIKAVKSFFGEQGC